MADASLRVITGPTAAGKSALALALAARVPVTVISADSRQLYRGFDIGTAKPSLAERAAVPHCGIDVADAMERWSAARWASSAREWIAAARSAGRAPVVVGGTGFYVRALVAPLFEEPALDPARRCALEALLARLSTAELRRWCARLDPARAHLGRAQLARAVEIALLTGVPITAWHARASNAPPLRARYLVVDPGPALPDAIASRAQAMVARGWVDEVARLESAVPSDAPAWNATGYAAIRDVGRGRSSLASALDRVIIDTRQYAKRQRTWIRHQLAATEVTRLDPRASDAVERAIAWWESTGNDEVTG